MRNEPILGTKTAQHERFCCYKLFIINKSSAQHEAVLGTVKRALGAVHAMLTANVVYIRMLPIQSYHGEQGF